VFSALVAIEIVLFSYILSSLLCIVSRFGFHFHEQFSSL